MTVPVTRSGDTLILPAGTNGAPPSKLQFTVKGDALVLSASGTESSFTRIGPAISATDPLLGKWKLDRPKVPNPDARLAALEEAQSKGIYSFNADGTESVRIPFTSLDGTWNADTHAFKLSGRDVAYSFFLSEGKLVLGQPPDNKTTDTYLPDPLFR